MPLLFPSVTNFIMKAFINGRRVFGTPIKTLPPVYPSLMVGTCVCVCVVMETLDCGNKPDWPPSAAGVFLRSRSSHRGGGGSKRPLLPHLRQDRPLHEGLPHAQKVGNDLGRCSPGASGYKSVIAALLPGSGPSRDGTRRDGPSTSETGWTWGRTAKIRPGRKTSTGRRGRPRRSAAASCAGPALT